LTLLLNKSDLKCFSPSVGRRASPRHVRPSVCLSGGRSAALCMARWLTDRPVFTEHSWRQRDWRRTDCVIGR